MKNNLLFVLVTPEGVKAEIKCFSVLLTAMDNKNGEGGGRVGIMHGHLPTIIALKNPSDIIIKSEEKEQTLNVFGGFCEIKDNKITVITEKA